ncbi:TonB-dependent receptor [Sphingobium sufflavum]|uniref:TonB-dependent receptor plug domain-containing protein n=1 Tax=Sphingobium sufflavum TaxID=1129547 RepID=UPI001F32F273|nr:TonB-dependent receptor [Sphingobium sufflavum]MCE7798833.1 TonB-dependent receptor [Sphingobium sufflavum]
MSRFLHRGRALFAAVAFLPGPVAAQGIDYAALGATFGEPVTTSVTGKPQRASEAPAALTIITREQIEHSPARDIPSLIKSYAGIDVNRWTAGQSDVAVRGGVQSYNPSILVMIDGRQGYLDHYGMTNWNLLAIELEQVQQIEVVRGPASAIFGFNAANGVINIITRSLTKARLDGTVEGGDKGYSRLSLGGALPVGEAVDLRLSAGRLREDERAIPSGYYAARNLGPAVERDHLAGSITARPIAGTEIVVNLAYARNRQQEYVASPTLGQVDTKMVTAGLALSHDMGWGNISGEVYATHFNFENWADSSQPGATVSISTRLSNAALTAKSSLLTRLGSDTTVRFGAEYRSNRMRGAILYSPTIGYDVWSASAMIDAHPADGIALTGALRADHLILTQSGLPNSPVLFDPVQFERSLTTVSFNAAMLLSVGDEGQLRINGGRGYQSPSLLALGIHVPAELAMLPLPVVASGDPSILPAEVWSIEIGYARPIVAGIRADASLFYMHSRNPIALANQTVEMVVGPTGQAAFGIFFANVLPITSYGLELSLAADLGRWNGRVNYSWLHSEDDGMSAQGGISHFLNAADATPRHKANVQVGYDTGRWFGTVAARYTSRTYQLAPLATVKPVRVADTVGIDAKVGLRLSGKMTVTLAGENLTKVRGTAGSPIWADRRVRAGLIFSL